MNIQNGASASLKTSRYGRRALAEEVAWVLRSVHGSRHNDVFAAACHIGNLIAGLEINEVEARAVLVAAAMERGLERSDAERQVDRGIATGRLTPRSASRDVWQIDSYQEAREWAVTVLQTIIADPDAAPGTKKIAIAIVCELIRFGRCETTQSLRQVAELAGVSVGTVWNHTLRLRRWLRHVPGCGPKGGRWRLLPVTHTVDMTMTTMPDSKANYWFRKPGEWFTYGLVSPVEETTLEELAAAAGLTVATVKGYVKRWEADGLVIVTDSGVIAVAGAKLPETEIDHAANRRARHVANRIQFMRVIADMIEERQLPAAERDRRREERKAAKQRRTLRDLDAGRKPRRHKGPRWLSSVPASDVPESPSSLALGEYPVAA